MDHVGCSVNIQFGYGIYTDVNETMAVYYIVDCATLSNLNFAVDLLQYRKI